MYAAVPADLKRIRFIHVPRCLQDESPESYELIDEVPDYGSSWIGSIRTMLHNGAHLYTLLPVDRLPSRHQC
jgi:hypothetical protein